MNIIQTEIDAWKKIIKDNDIVFDVGCQDDNIFYEINNTITAHLFDPVCYKNLVNKISDKPKVFYNQFALGSKETTKDFHFGYGSFAERVEVERLKPLSNISMPIQIRRLDDYVEQHKIDHIDFLKIDSEGFDFEVIKGAGKFLDKIKYIQFEEWGVDSPETYYGGENVEDILEFFKDWDIQKIDGQGDMNNYIIKNKQ